MIIRQKGFTILELMIATAVFSLVLMVSLAGIIQITKMYYQGITQTRTQEVIRTVTDDIAETIRFSKDAVIIPPTTIVSPKIAAVEPDTAHFCIGAKRYTYAIDRQLKVQPKAGAKQKNHVLWVDIDPTGNCSAAVNLDEKTPNVNGREILRENMRLSKFELTEDDGLYTIDISVVYGDTDLIEYNDDPITCKSAFAGAEFCGVSSLSVTVGKRL